MFQFIDVLSVVISVMGLLQAAFLFMVLRNEGVSARQTNRWMSIFLLALSLSFLRDIILLFGGTAVALMVEPFLFAAYFALGPSIYLYLREMSGNPARHPIRHLYPVVGVVICAAMMIAMVFWKYGDVLLAGAPLRITFESDFALSVIACGLLFGLFVFVITYHIAFSKTAYVYCQRLRAKGDVESLARRRWVLSVLLCLHVVLFGFVLSQVLQMAASDMHWSNILVNAGFVLTLLRLSFLLASQPFRMGVRNAKPTASGLENPAKSVVADEQSALICAKLDDVIADQTTLFDPLLTMPKLAAKIGVTPNQLSHTLNNVLGQSFFEFVNTVRVREAARLLCEDQDRTILDIAIAVGFNSKSTFNLAFKRVTGMTPSHYRIQSITEQDGINQGARFSLTPVTPAGN